MRADPPARHASPAVVCKKFCLSCTQLGSGHTAPCGSYQYSQGMNDAARYDSMPLSCGLTTRQHALESVHEFMPRLSKSPAVAWAVLAACHRPCQWHPGHQAPSIALRSPQAPWLTWLVSGGSAPPQIFCCLSDGRETPSATLVEAHGHCQ